MKRATVVLLLAIGALMVPPGHCVTFFLGFDCCCAHARQSDQATSCPCCSTRLPAQAEDSILRGTECFCASLSALDVPKTQHYVHAELFCTPFDGFAAPLTALRSTDAGSVERGRGPPPDGYLYLTHRILRI